MNEVTLAIEGKANQDLTDGSLLKLGMIDEFVLTRENKEVQLYSASSLLIQFRDKLPL